LFEPIKKPNVVSSTTFGYHFLRRTLIKARLDLTSLSMAEKAIALYFAAGRKTLFPAPCKTAKYLFYCRTYSQIKLNLEK